MAHEEGPRAAPAARAAPSLLDLPQLPLDQILYLLVPKPDCLLLTSDAYAESVALALTSRGALRLMACEWVRKQVIRRSLWYADSPPLGEDESRAEAEDSGALDADDPTFWPSGLRQMLRYAKAKRDGAEQRLGTRRLRVR